MLIEESPSSFATRADASWTPPLGRSVHRSNGDLAAIATSTIWCHWRTPIDLEAGAGRPLRRSVTRTTYRIRCISSR